MSDDITVRVFRPEDSKQVKKIFVDGMNWIMPTYPNTILRAIQYYSPIVYTSVFIVLLTLYSQITYYFTQSIALSTILSVIYLLISVLIYSAVIYLYCHKMKDDFVALSLGADLKDIHEYYNKGVNRFWVAIDDRTGEVVGCVGILEKDKDVLELKRMSVRSDMRRRGVGVKLMEALEAYCVGKCKKIGLGTSILQPPAMALYRKRGFTLKGTQYVSWFVPIYFLWFEKEV